MTQMFCNMKGLAKILGQSTQTDRQMLKEYELVEGVHYSYVTEKSNRLYYIPEIVKLYKPANACLYIPMVAI